MEDQDSRACVSEIISSFWGDKINRFVVCSLYEVGSFGVPKEKNQTEEIFLKSIGSAGRI